MDILSGITQAGAILNAARDVVQALKPEKGAKSSQTSAEEASASFQEALNEAHEAFVKARDLNGNGVLEPNEIEIDKKAFTQLDTDGDGALTVAELNEGYLSALENAGAKSAAREIWVI